MGGFKLDTSGSVRVPDALLGEPRERSSEWRWPDLSPFAQGYIEAALEAYAAYDIGPNPHNFTARFSDLAPATLAAMLEDCERMAAAARAPDADLGRTAWNLRQLGKITDYAPLTLYLADDGKVHQREGA